MGVGAKGDGTRAKPWTLKTPSGQSEFVAFRDPTLSPPALVVQVGKTELQYQLRCLDDLAAELKRRGDWVTLGSADEQKPATEGTVESWARSPLQFCCCSRLSYSRICRTRRWQPS